MTRSPSPLAWRPDFPGAPRLRQRQDLREGIASERGRMMSEHETNPELLLDVRALSAWYGAAQILFDVDLQVRRGEVVALMGRNGAGKSTTLKAVMGMLDKRRGTLSFMGR